MSPFEELRAVMDRLRDPGGCPWDREQTLDDLRSYVLEEAHEVVDAIDGKDHEHLRDELGDLLLQVVFISRIESEDGHFDVDDVVRGLRDKLVRRHPHVFGDAAAGTAAEVVEQWETIKRREHPDRRSVLAGVPRSLPALLRAWRLSAKAAATGFDWEKEPDLEAKLREELEEFLQDVDRGDAEGMAREFGDLLFVLVNLARRAAIDPEASLQGACDRFVERFTHIETRLADQGRDPGQATLEEMEALWQEAKRGED
jgi:tetrapyrrole methylase family protein/MazG family protein